MIHRFHNIAGKNKTKGRGFLLPYAAMMMMIDD